MRGTSVDSGRQRPTATKVSVVSTPAVTSLVLPMPASPVTRRSPVPVSRCRRTAVSSALRPAIRGGAGWAGRRAWRRPATGRGTRPCRRRGPRRRARGCPRSGGSGQEKVLETVVWETPVSRASSRREGQPARWWRSWRASLSVLLGPGASSGRGSALMGPPTTAPASRILPPGHGVQPGSAVAQLAAAVQNVSSTAAESGPPSSTWVRMIVTTPWRGSTYPAVPVPPTQP